MITEQKERKICLTRERKTSMDWQSAKKLCSEVIHQLHDAFKIKEVLSQ
jgi:hypothetical protein